MSKGTIKKVAGPLVIAQGMRDANMFDVCRVSDQRLIGEIIEIHGDQASVQVYEETSGLGPGEPVESTGAPLSVELGPGLIGSIFDGIQRPLETIMAVSGNNLQRGVEVPSLNREKSWHFVPSVKAGDKVTGGDIIGSVQETKIVSHKIMVPNGIIGTVKSIEEGDFTVTQTVAVIENENGGLMHQIKVLDIPAGKFRDKGVPIDNLCNYDSAKEYIIQVLDAQTMIHSTLLFATAKSMLKVMDGDLLNASKRTVQATKLSEDELVAVIVADWSEESEDKVVLQTKDGVFLKFPYAEIPKKKKSALGVRGMKLSKDDLITNVYVMDAQNISSIMYKEKELEFNRLKLSKRDTKGTKVRR